MTLRLFTLCLMRWSSPLIPRCGTRFSSRNEVIGRVNIAGVIAHLQEAEKQASGRERNALQLELAQLRDSRRYADAATYFKKAADETDQEELRKHALKKAEAMLKLKEAQRAGKNK